MFSYNAANRLSFISMINIFLIGLLLQLDIKLISCGIDVDRRYQHRSDYGNAWYWDYCSLEGTPDKNVIRVNEINFADDGYPMVLGSGVHAWVNFTIFEDITENWKASVSTSSIRTIGGLFDYDVKGKFRSDALCDFLAHKPESPLCQLFTGIFSPLGNPSAVQPKTKCDCPLPAGTYSAPVSWVPPKEWQIAGTYDVRLVLAAVVGQMTGEGGGRRGRGDNSSSEVEVVPVVERQGCVQIRDLEAISSIYYYLRKTYNYSKNLFQSKQETEEEDDDYEDEDDDEDEDDEDEDDEEEAEEEAQDETQDEGEADQDDEDPFD